nr:UDP-glucuronic acid decarboxylase family protein [uncultured Roseococcus sp.]
MLAKKKILITGGSGFLGSHLADQLIRKNNSVICLDNFCSSSSDNINHLISHPDFRLIRHDISQPFHETVDEIYNLACPASPKRYQTDPIQTMRTSILGAFHLLDLARNLGCKVFQASTSEVYGDPESHPQREDYWGHVNPIGVRACYDEGKRCAETLFFDYRRQHGLGIKVARIFNTYGPRMQAEDGRVVSNFIVQALTNQDLTIYGQGEQTRAFCYVDDMIEGITRLMATPDEVTGPINLGNPSECTVIELAETILRLTGSRSRLVCHPLPQDDPRQRRPDITRARETLGWAPRVPLEDGLKATIEYFEQHLSRPDRQLPAA